MGWGRSQCSDAQVSSGSTIQVPGEEVEEDECDRGLEAILKLPWERRHCPGVSLLLTQGPGIHPLPGSLTFFGASWSRCSRYWKWLLGPGACCGLSLDLRTEEGGV